MIHCDLSHSFINGAEHFVCSVNLFMHQGCSWHACGARLCACCLSQVLHRQAVDLFKLTTLARSDSMFSEAAFSYCNSFIISSKTKSLNWKLSRGNRIRLK